MSKNIKLVILGTIGALVGYFGMQYLIDNYSTNSPSVDAALAIMAEEVNKSCPMAIDQYTRLDTSIGGPGKQFSYYYTLLAAPGAEIDVSALKNNLAPTIKNMVRTSPDMVFFRDNNITLNYNYRDREGVSLFSITVTPKDYQE